jgi:murein DD-endopeptidase MepM/ murein hydrolase activator NlpD
MVEIDHGGGFTTRYAHLKSIEVAVGEEVAAGTIVGEVGSSGRSTGPHLHYEIRKDGDALDPLAFLKAGKRIGQYL